DTMHVIGVALMVWMFLTPIFYPPYHVVQKGFGWTLDVNPMHWLMEMYRGAMVKNLWPEPTDLARFGVAAVVVFFLGTTFFSTQRKKFADLL
ncbi:MAG: ABC transporter permease, partial [Planctomycetota bacterium]